MISNDNHATFVRPLTSRLYETERDLAHMLDLLMEGRSRADDWHYCHIGDLVWRFFMISCRGDPREDIRLWYDADKLIGYAVLGGDDVSVDWQVLPEYEWRGIEIETMAWAETRLAELAVHDPQEWGGDVAARSPADNLKRIAFLEEREFVRGRYSEVNLIRPLDASITDPILPAIGRVRGMAGAEDVSNRAGAHRDVWRPYTVSNVSDDDYARFMRLPGYDPNLDIVAVAPDGVIGAYAMGWIDPVNLIGDFGPVGARPGYRRQGLARAALLEGLRRMQARGVNRAGISTGSGNVAALSLYQSIGFSVVNTHREYVKSRSE